MLPSKQRMCHRTGFDKSCRQLVADDACGRWRKISGVPASGKEEDLWDCIDDHAHTLSLNILAAIQGEAAASEQFRNVVAEARNARLLQAQLRAINHQEPAE